MKTIIKIKNNTRGFLNTKASFYTSENDITIDVQELKGLSTRYGFILLNIVIALILFGIIEWFVVIRLFGDIMNSWLQFFSGDANKISGILVFISLVKIILGIVVLILFPLYGTFWVSNKLTLPLKKKSSINKSETFSFFEIDRIFLNSKNFIELFYRHKENITIEIVQVENNSISFLINLLYLIIRENKSFAIFIGGTIDKVDNSDVIKLKVLEKDVIISKDFILYPESNWENIVDCSDSIYSELIINYLFAEAFLFLKGNMLKTQDNYSGISSMSDMELNKDLEILSNNFKEDKQSYSNFLKKLIDAGLIANEVNNQYLIKVFPKITIKFDYKNNGNRQSDFEIYYQIDLYEYFGKQFMTNVFSFILSFLIANSIEWEQQ